MTGDLQERQFVFVVPLHVAQVESQLAQVVGEVFTWFTGHSQTFVVPFKVIGFAHVKQLLEAEPEQVKQLGSQSEQVPALFHFVETLHLHCPLGLVETTKVLSAGFLQVRQSENVYPVLQVKHVEKQQILSV